MPRYRFEYCSYRWEIIFLQPTIISRTHYEREFFNQIKGIYVQPTANGSYYLFTFRNFSSLLPPTDLTDKENNTKHCDQVNSYSMSLVGEIIDNPDVIYSMKSSMKLSTCLRQQMTPILQYGLKGLILLNLKPVQFCITQQIQNWYGETQLYQ